MDFLKPAKFKWKDWMIFTGFSALVLLGLFFSANKWNWDEIGRKLIEVSVWSNGAFTSIYTSLVAAVIFAYLTRAPEESQLSRIAKLAEKDFLNDFFSELQDIDGRYCSDYNVGATLFSHHTREDLCFCEIVYSYKKILTDSRLSFCYERWRNKDHVSGSALSSVAYFENEFYFSLDEVQISPSCADGDYTITDVVVDGAALTLEGPNLKNEGLLLEYSARIPTPTKNKLASIHFTARFPLEIESVLTLNTELPTKTVYMKVDASALIDKIEIAGHAMFSRTKGPNSVKQARDGIVSFNCHGWVLPKNGVVCSWWKKAQR